MTDHLSWRARLRRTYGRIAPLYDLIDLPFEYGRYRRLRPAVFAALDGAVRLLDCGAGTGRNSPYYPAGADVVGLELSWEMLVRGRRRARDARRRMAWVQGDVTRLPWAGDSFDAASATFLFCVLPDALQPAALRELARVIRPAGRLVLLEYVLSRRPFRRWLMTRIWGPWVAWAYGAGFDRRTSEHLRAEGWLIEESRFVHDDTVVLIVARPPAAGPAEPSETPAG